MRDTGLLYFSSSHKQLLRTRRSYTAPTHKRNSTHSPRAHKTVVVVMVATQGAVIVSRPVLAHDQRKSYTINYPVGGRMS